MASERAGAKFPAGETRRNLDAASSLGGHDRLNAQQYLMRVGPMPLDRVNALRTFLQSFGVFVSVSGEMDGIPSQIKQPPRADWGNQ